MQPEKSDSLYNPLWGRISLCFTAPKMIKLHFWQSFKKSITKLQQMAILKIVALSGVGENGSFRKKRNVL